MAYKMKAGKEGPMKKNFPSAFKHTKPYEHTHGPRVFELLAGVSATGDCYWEKFNKKRRRQAQLEGDRQHAHIKEVRTTNKDLDT